MNSATIGQSAASGAKLGQQDDYVNDMAEVHQFSEAELRRLKIVHSGLKSGGLLKTFRDLRTQVAGLANGRNYSCLVCSVVSGGGASYIARNLAASVALDKSKSSIIVDANFYQPSAHELIVTDADQGLTDLIGENSLQVEDVVYATGLPRVRVLPVGGNREGATERLSSQRMKELTVELKTRYRDRYVFFDGPSVAESLADVRLLSSLCDFTLLVVPYGEVTEEQIEEASEAISKNKLAGLVFNYR